MPLNIKKKRKILFFSITVLLIIFFVFMQKNSWTWIPGESEKMAVNHPTRMVFQDVTASKTIQLAESTMNKNSLATNKPAAIETATKVDEQLPSKMDEILDRSELNGALTGVSIRTAAEGKILYSHLGDTRLRPASNMKLLTAATALETLGEDYQFTTEVLTDGTVEEHVLQGNLYIKGKGDPTLLKEDFDQLAKELKKLDIQRIQGNVIGDDSWYDDIRYSQDLNWSNEFEYTGAAISALTISPNDDYNTGTVVVRVYPSDTIGERPEVEIIPKTDYMTIVNKAKTVRKGHADGLTIEREHGTNKLIVSGNMPMDSTIEAWRAVWEPTDYALHIFKQALENQGIQDVNIKRGIAPVEARQLILKESMPLKDLLIPFMKQSNNSHGEILVKEMGKVVHDEGSWEKGLQVLEEELANLGVNTDTTLFRDGSGMSHKNLIPPNELSKLLFEIQSKSWYETFERSQPVAGESDRMIGGTLSYRLTDETTKGKVKAKTGSLTGVNTLSGYLTTQEDEKLIFSIMINNFIDGWMPNIQDTIVQMLIEHEYSD